jgi:hypothetical protein
MTDKYTAEYVKSIISTSDIDYITELMNDAYRKGKEEALNNQSSNEVYSQGYRDGANDILKAVT